MKSPISLSLSLLRALGYEAEIVEHFVRFGAGRGGIRRDLFGFADILALGATIRPILLRTLDLPPDKIGYLPGTILLDPAGVKWTPPATFLAVQTTTETHLEERRAKIDASPKAHRWFICGGTIEIHLWTTRERRLDRKRVICRIFRAAWKTTAEAESSASPSPFVWEESRRLADGSPIRQESPP